MVKQVSISSKSLNLFETYWSSFGFNSKAVLQGWQQKMNGNRNNIQMVISQQQLQKLASAKASWTDPVIRFHWVEEI